MIKRIIFSLVLLMPLSLELMATHIRAGEIIAQRISNSSFRYRFSIIGYTDTESTVEFAGGTIDFGDGRVENLNEVFVGSPQFFIIEENVAFNQYNVEHTFPGPGRYVVRYNEQNRNAGVVNMSNSVDTPFYIETEVLIDPAVGLNNSPSFLIAPIDRGAEGATFLHNPGAFDPDGDSLSYRLTEPKQFFDRTVNDYVEPNDAQFYTNFLEGNQNSDGPPVFRIDSISGTVIWDAPGLMGEYNIAFVVDEWRQIDDVWARIGSVTRDMQIIIEETDNLPPVIDQPEEACVQAGRLYEEVITATDPDGHDIEMEAFGGPFTFEISPATFTPFPVEPQPQPAAMTINWQTDMTHVRERPYEIQLKARDVPGLGPRLVDFKTLLVTVVAPPPTGVSVTLLENRRASLQWDPYSSAADSIEIWRRVDSFSIDTTDCIVGMPANAGYQLIAKVANGSGTNSYFDDNGGFGLAPGALYCYRIVATFPLPAGGSSYVSEEVCQLVEVIAPVTLNVDVTATGENDGQIDLRWISPFDVDEAEHPRPFSYDLYRYEAIGGPSTFVAFTQDTVFNDTGINTLDNQYFYRIFAYNANVVESERDTSSNYGPYIDASIPASSVRLSATSQVETIDLSWEANTPWSIVAEDFPQHYIYRATGDGFGDLAFSLIDSANVTESGLKYSDDGSFNGQPLDEDIVYYYFTETQGTYGNEVFPSPLLNKSQIVSAQPNDLEPPCTPVSFNVDESFNCEEFLATRGCDFQEFSISLSWLEDGESACDNDIESYNIYYAEEDTVGGLELLANVVGTEFEHTGKNSFKGYYQISSVDRSGNESELSEVLVVDNCPNIRLPNAFTPNGDGVNDTFTPFTDFIGTQGGQEGEGVNVPDFDNSNCPRFVERLNFKVFDRTGGTLFTFNSNDSGSSGELGGDITINWDGTNNNGRDLPSGTYYYKMDVRFDALDPKLRSKTYNGWIQIIR